MPSEPGFRGVPEAASRHDITVLLVYVHVRA